MPQTQYSTEHIQHNVGSPLVGTILLLLLFEAQAKVLYPITPKSGRTLCADMHDLVGCTLGLLVGCPLRRTSKQVVAMAFASFLPMSVLHDKTFPYTAGQEGRGKGRRCLERYRNIYESTVYDLGCDFISHSPVSYTLSATQGWWNLNSSNNKIRRGKPGYIRLVEN